MTIRELETEGFISIATLAKANQLDADNPINLDIDLMDDALNGNFNHEDTNEGPDFWDEVLDNTTSLDDLTDQISGSNLIRAQLKIATSGKTVTIPSKPSKKPPAKGARKIYSTYGTFAKPVSYGGAVEEVSNQDEEVKLEAPTYYTGTPSGGLVGRDEGEKKESNKKMTTEEWLDKREISKNTAHTLDYNGIVRLLNEFKNDLC